MRIIGCDYHPGFQQIAYVDTDTGEFAERRLAHREEAEQFYRELAAREVSVRVGMEASGHARWFERLSRSCSLAVDRRCRRDPDQTGAQLTLRLLMEDRFPRIWVASWENGDLRQLLVIGWCRRGGGS